MLNPQTSGIQPQSRHNNRGGRRDPIQHHMPQYQSRAAAPLYQQPYGANVRPTTHRVLLPQGHHQQMFALPMNAGGIGRGLMQSAPRQSNLFSQHQQMMPSHQYPPHFAAPAFVPGQGTQQPINLLQQHPGQMMPPPQMAGAAIPTQSLQTQQQPMMRPQHNPMVVYSAEQQQQQQQQQSGNQQAQQTFAKRKRNAIKIIDPDTNTEVDVGGKDSGSDSNTLDDKTNTGRSTPNPVAEDFKKQVEAVSSTSIEPLEVSEPESDATSASTTAEYLPNAIITKPPMDSIKPKTFPPILDGPSDLIPAEETVTPSKPEVDREAEPALAENDSKEVGVKAIVVESNVAGEVDTATTTSANRSEVVPESKDDISKSENVGVNEDSVVLKQPEATTDVDDKLSDDRSQASAENGPVECEPEATEVPVNSEDSSEGGSPQEQLELRNETQSSQDSMSGNSSATSSSSQIETTQSLPPPTSDTADPTVDLVSSTTNASNSEGEARDSEGETLQDERQPEPVSPVHAKVGEIPSEGVAAPVDQPPSVSTNTDSEPERSPEVVPRVDVQKENVENMVNGSTTVIMATKEFSGKKRYERDFLIQFKNLPVCKEVPPNLKTSAVFTKDGGHTPMPQGGGGGGGYHYSNRQPDKRNRQRADQPKKILVQPMEKKVVLHKAEKPWMPMAKGDTGDGSAEDAQATELYRKFQGILNKLTPQKFQSLAEQALKLEINTEERLSRCIDKIFTKALEEPSFSIAYANLCKVMSPIKVEYQSEDGKAKQTNFRRMLLTKCQKEFEKDKKDDESRESMQKDIDNAETDAKRAALKEELESAFTKSRKRSLGNIRFIGELFKLQMLSETIMHECITRLLKSTSDEESLECFARLITTTGKDLDKEQARGRIDAYFKRITDIIKKGKVPARVRFMLQDVLDLRDHCWVPRVRQDKQLKTIDQIHAEAAMEEAKEKEIIQHHQVSMKGAAGGRDSRRGSKDDHMMKDRDHRRGERENFDRTKLNKFISNTRKDKGNVGQGHLGPQAVLRPGWKKNGPSTQTSEGSKLGGKAVPRSATNPGPKSRTDTRTGNNRQSSMPGPRRSHTTPESERESMLQTVTEFSSKPSEAVPSAPASHAPSRDAPAQAILCSDKRPSAPTPISEEAIASVQRKVTSTIDELVLNKDYKEAIECVKEIDLPGAMRQVVVEGINHTLERKAVFRTVTGELFSRLVQEKIITQQDFSHGLSEFLEGAEDMCIDIPKIWDYLGEVLAPVFAQEIISLSILKSPPASLLESGRAAVLVAKVLCHCVCVLKGEEEVKGLWARCGLTWDDLGKPKEDVEEFLERQNLSFLLVQNTVATKELPPTLLESLRAQLISPDTPNEDINVWIKSNCSEQEYDPAVLVSNLTSVVVQASVSGGSGDHAVFSQDGFERRIEVVKGQGHHGLAVLHGLQCSVAKLSHPPKLFHNLLNMTYDIDLFEEQDFYNWLDDDRIMYGKGTAVALAKPFLDWLKADGGKSSETT